MRAAIPAEDSQASTRCRCCIKWAGHACSFESFPSATAAKRDTESSVENKDQGEQRDIELWMSNNKFKIWYFIALGLFFSPRWYDRRCVKRPHFDGFFLWRTEGDFGRISPDAAFKSFRSMFGLVLLFLIFTCCAEKCFLCPTDTQSLFARLSLVGERKKKPRI